MLSCPPVSLVPSRSTEGKQAGTPTQKKYLSLDVAVKSEEKQKETKGFGECNYFRNRAQFAKIASLWNTKKPAKV